MSRESSASPSQKDVNGDTLVPEQKEGKSEEIFEVERILSHKISDNDLMLKVRWVGYGPEEDTWEPEGDLRECANEVVREYYRKMKVNDKTELIDILQRKIKVNKAKAQKRDRSESEGESDDSDSSFHKSKSSVKKQKKSKKSNSQTPSSSKIPKVPTKAALKSYEATLAATVTPNNAKKAAMEVRDHRREWLEDDSSDDEPDAPLAESEIEKIASKVKGKSLEKPKEKEPETPQKPAKPEWTSPASVPKSSVSKKNGSCEPSTSQRTLTSPPAELPKAAAQERVWTVDGIVRHTDDKNVRKKLILMTNTKTGDRKVLDSEEAFALDGWALTKYLLDRCEF